jgi:DNA-directed RNA polymerase subunit RPC12/RpoP
LKEPNKEKDMNISEKAAYLKGLSDGMKLDETKNESKLLKGIIDLLADIAHEIEDINENELDLAEEIDQISEDLAIIEEEFYDDECCDGCCCDDDDDEEDDEEPVFYEVTCPSCGKTITVDEDVLLYDSIECPGCGEKLEFEFDDDEEDEDDEEE